MRWNFKMAREVSRLNGTMTKDALNKIRFECGIFLVSLDINEIDNCVFRENLGRLAFQGYF